MTDTKNNLSPIEMYYENIIKRVNELIENKKYNEALEILEDELEAPYIPKKQEEILEDLANSIMAELHYFKNLNNYNELKRNQLFDKIIHNNKLDTMALFTFFERFGNDISKEELNEIKDLFKSRKLSNENKELIFLLLSNQKINTEISFYNSFLKEEFLINTGSTKTYATIDLFSETEKKIYELAMKEPSLMEFCKSVLRQIYIYNFPQIPNFNSDELSYGIFNYMLYSLQGDKIKVNKHIFDYVNNIIRAFNK